MRDILFRGRDPETGTWYEGQYIHLHKTTYCIAEDYEGLSGNDIHQIVFEHMTDWGLPNRHLRADVDPATVGQYTGLTDKNGKKIFEGDIMRGTMGDMVVFYGEIIGYGYGFQWKAVDGGACESMTGFIDEYEVISNIHDNPELLEEHK